MTGLAKRSFEIRGWHVLAAMILFFGSIILVNVVFALAAIGTFPGEDAQRPYLQGIHYNQTLSERRTQTALGWASDATFVEEDGAVNLVVRLTDRAGANVNGAVVTGALQWPTDAHRDRTITFTQAGAGQYVAQLGALDEGRWRLRAHAEREADALDFESELRWPNPR
jgi:nitrogen fixation protein FixH